MIVEEDFLDGQGLIKIKIKAISMLKKPNSMNQNDFFNKFFV